MRLVQSTAALEYGEPRYLAGSEGSARPSVQTVTGKGFQPGQSGNPQGRPRTKGLVNALKAAVAEEVPDGRTVEEALADTLIEEGLNGKHRLAAISAIYDRIEGKPRQSISFEDARKQEQEEIAGMTDEQLYEILRPGFVEFEATKKAREVAQTVGDHDTNPK